MTRISQELKIAGTCSRIDHLGYISLLQPKHHNECMPIALESLEIQPSAQGQAIDLSFWHHHLLQLLSRNEI
jgi:hypothetical protein